VEDCGADQSHNNDAAEPQIDDERGADRRAPVGERREDDGAEARDQVADDVGEQGERSDAVERAPAAGFAQQRRQDPGIEQRPRRQQDERMGDAAVREDVLDRADEADDEIEVGRGAGEEAGGDAPRQGARRRVLGRGGAGEKRSGERVGQRVQSGDPSRAASPSPVRRR
jgi:hypothetical protein